MGSGVETDRKVLRISEFSDGGETGVDVGFERAAVLEDAQDIFKEILLLAVLGRKHPVDCDRVEDDPGIFISLAGEIFIETRKVEITGRDEIFIHVQRFEK